MHHGVPPELELKTSASRIVHQRVAVYVIFARISLHDGVSKSFVFCGIEIELVVGQADAAVRRRTEVRRRNIGLIETEIEHPLSGGVAAHDCHIARRMVEYSGQACLELSKASVDSVYRDGVAFVDGEIGAELLKIGRSRGEELDLTDGSRGRRTRLRRALLAKGE